MDFACLHDIKRSKLQVNVLLMFASKLNDVAYYYLPNLVQLIHKLGKQ